MSSIQEIEHEIVEEFTLFDNWTDKYQYIIELGEKLPPFPAEKKIEELKIKGCQSNVWVLPAQQDGYVFFQGDSDSSIVKGLVALLIRVLSGQKPEQVANAKLEFIDRIGLTQHLAPTRANGLAFMVQQMKAYAQSMQASGLPESVNTNEPSSGLQQESTLNHTPHTTNPFSPLIISKNPGLTQKVIDVIKSCYDPEIPVDIWELGLIYEISINEANEVYVKMTLTSPMCPVAETLPPDVENKIRGIEEVTNAKVEITFEPPWDKDMMSEEAKLELGFW